MRYPILRYGEQLFLILKNIGEHQFKDKDENINLELVQDYTQYVGGENIIQVNGRIVIVKRIEDAEIIEVGEESIKEQHPV